MRQKRPLVHPDPIWPAITATRPSQLGPMSEAQGEPARPRGPKPRHSAALEAPLPPNLGGLHTPRAAQPRRPPPATTRPAQLRRRTPRAEQALPPLAHCRQQSHTRPQAAGGTKISGGPQHDETAENPPQQHSLHAPHQRGQRAPPGTRSNTRQPAQAGRVSNCRPNTSRARLRVAAQRLVGSRGPETGKGTSPIQGSPSRAGSATHAAPSGEMPKRALSPAEPHSVTATLPDG
ncbi:hypothetical protein NDU88_003580 [Pleurodeles waltl]|uniref:Uncharacterized protein n=1 Tax=Pleurodeles waltl TaxID=8319 RepID=A0AAV7VDU2_PLEWA|nr:hypothetical protein NDU88_003578 [Pleurodeles waltl]KAJ1199747.1 hypothetical protein NDU88_003580 [Pleurodeles waltl]